MQSKPVFRPMKRRNVYKEVAEWTTGEGYSGIRHLRLGKAGTLQNATQRAKAEKLNHALALMMRHYAYRAPQIPPGDHRQVTQLFRGMYGGAAKEFLHSGTFVSNHYIAFSTTNEVAQMFMYKDMGVVSKPPRVVMTLPIMLIPPGTPWIWFSQSRGRWKNQRFYPQYQKTSRIIQTLVLSEQEVLLPPGTLIHIPHLPQFAHNTRRLSIYVTKLHEKIKMGQVPPTLFRIKKNGNKLSFETVANAVGASFDPVNHAHALWHALSLIRVGKCARLTLLRSNLRNEQLQYMYFLMALIRMTGHLPCADIIKYEDPLIPPLDKFAKGHAVMVAYRSNPSATSVVNKIPILPVVPRPSTKRPPTNTQNQQPPAKKLKAL